LRLDPHSANPNKTLKSIIDVKKLKSNVLIMKSAMDILKFYKYFTKIPVILKPRAKNPVKLN